MARYKQRKQNFLKDSSIIMMGELAVRFLTLIYIFPLNLTDPKLNVYSGFVFNAIAYAIVVSSFGLNFVLVSSISRNLGKDDDKVKTVVLNAFGLALFSAISCALVMLFAPELLNTTVSPSAPEYDTYIQSIRYLSITIFLYNISLVSNAISIAFGYYKEVSFYLVMEQVIKIVSLLAICMFMFNINDYDLIYTFYVTVFSMILSMTYVCIQLVRTMLKTPIIRVIKENTYIKTKESYMEFAKFCALFYGASLYFTVFDQMDFNVIKENYNSSEAARIFNEFLNFSLKMVYIPMQLSTAFTSTMIRKINTSKNKGYELNKIFDYVFIFISFFFVFLFVLIDDVAALGGVEDIHHYSKIQVFVITVYIFKNLLTNYSINTRASLVHVFVSSVLIIPLKYVLNIFFFELFGVYGLPMASVVAVGVSLVYLNIVLPEVRIDRKTLLYRTTVVLSTTLVLIISCSILIGMEILFEYSLWLLIVKGIIIAVVYAIFMGPVIYLKYFSHKKILKII